MNRSAIVTAALLAAAPAALAQHAGDVFLYVEDNAIATGLINEATGELEPGVRVFGSEFGEFEPNFTDEPGFDNEPGTFNPATSIGFTVHRALRSWDGSDFDAIPEERISIDFFGQSSVLTPLADTPVVGFSLRVGSNGEWHRHLQYTIQRDEGVRDGVYLLELSLWSTDPGLAESRTFWFVFNQNDTEENHDAAIAWVEQNLAGGCPADFNGDGAVDSDDFFDFLNAFNAGDLAADFNGDGLVDSDDFFDFLNAFNTGC